MTAVENAMELYPRPQPPESLLTMGYLIEPTMEVADWLMNVFIREGAPLYNPEHKHLQRADIAVIWTNVEYVEGFMPVAGWAELVKVNGKPWVKAEKTDHLCMLHGRIPDMRIWLYAPSWALVDDDTACARTEHELYHFAQKRDKENEPQFQDDGRPVWAMRSHDVEEHVGVMERYGVDACAGRSKDFVAAALRAPLLGRARSAGACGTCGGRMP